MHENGRAKHKDLLKIRYIVVVSVDVITKQQKDA